MIEIFVTEEFKKRCSQNPGRRGRRNPPQRNLNSNPLKSAEARPRRILLSIFGKRV